jgi:ribosomal protein L11 methyltransferase
MQTTSWLEIAVEVDPESVETVAEILARYGYNGGVVIEQGWIAGDEGPEFQYDPHRPVWLRTYLPLDAQVEETRQQIEHALWHVHQIRPLGPIQTRTLAEEDWANAWKQFYSVMRVGKRTIIVPSWLEYQPQPDDIVLLLDPGMAFGTGLHPTTRLCLNLLEQLVQPGQDVLDLGTGSGILAIAAAKLGAGRVLALDNDPIAVRVAQENIDRNRVGNTVTVAEGSLGVGQAMGHWLSGDFGPPEPDPALHENGLQTTFDLIAANLIARVLIALAPDLATALKPGGLLISSGIIDVKEEEVAAAFTAAGLQPIARHVEGEWVALVHRRI